MCLGHESLQNHLQTNFSLMQHHNYTLSDLDFMLPYEREIYVNMLIKYLEEEKQKQKRSYGYN